MRAPRSVRVCKVRAAGGRSDEEIDESLAALPRGRWTESHDGQSMPELNKRSLFSARSDAGETAAGERRRRLRGSVAIRYVILTIATVVVSLMMPHSTLVDYHNEIGSIWTGDTLRAPFAFPLYKDEGVLQQEMESAADSVMPIFTPTGVTATTLADTLVGLADAIAIGEQRPGFISESAWAFLQTIPQEERAERLRRISQVLVESVEPAYRAGIIDQAKRTLGADEITIRRAEVYEEVRPQTALYDSLDVLHTIESVLSRRLDPVEGGLAMELFARIYKPTLSFSQALTDEARGTARDAVPRSLGVVAEGETIVAKGERITELAKLKLNSFKRSRELREVETKPWWQLLGNLLHVGILVGLAMFYLFNFRQRIYSDNLQIGIMFGLITLIAAVAWGTRVLQSNLPLEYLIPVPLLTMLLVILFDSRTAFYLTVTACFIIAGIRGADYFAALAGLSAGVLAIYAVRDIRSRTQLFRSIVYSIGGYFVAILALSLGRGDDFESLAVSAAFAAINSTFSPVLTFAMILLLENVFGLATDLKLVEYDDLNHPLLRALADKAPGTYQHTLTIARLAESAAMAVNANALLTKVGALFHDIGKIPKAEYFVENQMGMGNKHDKIKPEKSAKIIREHVLDGIELAREYGLPQRIIDFIPMHHGTTAIQYFLDKAREANAEVDEASFHYPGPLPQSRETGITMLADAVEATTRSLPNPTRKAIEETVDRVIKRRFSEGQLDQCELTLADLTKIKEAFVKNLIGISHPRIQYRGDEPRDLEKPPGRRRDMPIPYIDDAFNVDAEYTYARKGGGMRDEGGGKKEEG
jgi:cyclic-di-AMP phosphodiesterase PgpH